MLPPNFKTTWHLSDNTTAKWLSGGSIKLIRKKFDILGREKESYKVYVKARTYLTILERHREVERAMEKLVEEGTSMMASVPLHGNFIIQLSLFQTDVGKVDRHPYYGIHLIDDEGEIVVGKGMNLTREEYLAFIRMLRRWRGDGNSEDGQGESGDETQVGSKKENYRLKKEEEVKEEGERKTKKRKVDSALEDGSSSKVAKFITKKISVNLYGWEWVEKESDYIPLTPEGQGGWHIDPQNCLQEALNRKPTGLYRLETLQKRMDLVVGEEMFEAAFAKLVINKVKEIKTQLLSYSNPPPMSDGPFDDYDIYGKDAVEMVQIGDIFSLCKTAISRYQSSSIDMDHHLMKCLGAFNKSETIFYMIRQNHLNDHFVQLFDYIG